MNSSVLIPLQCSTIRCRNCCGDCHVVDCVGHPVAHPNIVMIMADDLGYETIACNGGTSYKTPVLDN